MRSHLRFSLLRLSGVVVLLLGSVLIGYAQQTFKVEGKVTDAKTGMALSYVNIVVRGTQYGIATDSEGKFKLELPTEEPIIVSISHIGYEKWSKELLVLSPRELEWSVKLSPQSIDLTEVSVTSQRPFMSKRARYILTSTDFEKLAEPDMERALRYLLPDVISSWDVRLSTPSKDFTLYVDGKWMESFEVFDIDPYSIRQVLVWESHASPIAFPVRRGNLVVSIMTEKRAESEEVL